VSADLAAARVNPSSPANVPLQPRDRVTIFELGIARSAAMATILAELQAEATRKQSFRMVQVGGRVTAPGRYPLEEGMRVSDLLRAGGGLSASAYLAEAEMRRFSIDGTGTRRTQLLTVDIAAIDAGDQTADLRLEPYDYLNVKEVPAWEDQLAVEIVGEVRFPGVYPVRRGETLSSVLERAGGLTEAAFPEGSVFTRLSLREREADQLRQFERRLESDLAALGLRSAADPSGNSQQAMSVGQSLLEQIRSTEPTGRLVIELDKLVASDSDEYDIVLRNQDKLYIPQRSQEIMVLGEVQYATSHLYAAGRDRDGYIALSGGLTSNADGKRVYIVRANGAVQASSGSRWFRGRGGQMYPGDTIVAPIETDRVPTVVQWASITQILYNLAISVAAVNSF
jgi:protein involved in polysaccharide export with SLBB domain